MASELFRRLSALLLTLVLVTGLVTHGAQAAQMSVGMATTVAMDGPMPDGCDGCDPDGGSAKACALFCSALLAVLPASLDIEVVEAVVERPVAVFGGMGLRGPPDPLPPKPALAA